MNLNLHSRHDDLEIAKLCSLEHLNGQIGELEKSLEEMRARRKQLEQDLATIRALRAPIRRLPTEIFVSIFEETLHGIIYQDRERVKFGSEIVRLMLVCKDWHRIIIGSPKLWSKIHIQATGKKYGHKWLSQQGKYVEALMEHSGNVPVDVSLDLGNLLSGAEYVSRRVDEVLDDFTLKFEGDHFDDMDYDYFDWIEGLGQGSPVAARYESLHQDLFSLIVGRDGIHMKRWRSLQFSLPCDDDDFAANLLNGLDYPAPQLLQLNLDAWDLSERWETHSFRRLSTLDRIVLSGGFTPALIPESLGARKIELNGLDILDAIEHLNSFRNLRYLRLQAEGRRTHSTFHPITIPHLQTLRLGGQFPDSFFHAFTIKFLPELIIDCLGERNLGYVPYPTADLFRIVGTVNVIVPEWRCREPGIRKDLLHLPGLFTQLSIASSIGVVDKVAKEVLSLIENCRAKGELAALRSLATVYENGDTLDRNEYATFFTIAYRVDGRECNVLCELLLQIVVVYVSPHSERLRKSVLRSIYPIFELHE